MPHIAEMKKKQDSAHWYTAQGQSQHGATLREARKSKLLPSVTSVLSVIAKPGLEQWRREQCVKSALDTMRYGGEPESEFIDRIVANAEHLTRKAADFGTAIHDACEGVNLGGIITGDPKLAPFVQHYAEWMNQDIKEVISVESVAVNAESGYAGRIDLQAITKHGEAIVDIKTQKIKKKPEFYPTWGMQLAAYAKCRGIKLGISVVINSEKPEPVYIKLWDDLEPYYEAFTNCLKLWCFDRNYYPQRKEINENSQTNS